MLAFAFILIPNSRYTFDAIGEKDMTYVDELVKAPSEHSIEIRGLISGLIACSSRG